MDSVKRKRIAIWIVLLLVLAGIVFFFIAHHHKSASVSHTTQTDTVKPQISLTLNKNALKAVTGTLQATVDASDNKGVSRVEYKIDGVFAGVSYSAPFSMSLDVSGLTPGTHTLTATAYDAAGNASNSVSVSFTIVANSTPSTSSSSGGASSPSAGSSDASILQHAVSSTSKQSTSGGASGTSTTGGNSGGTTGGGSGNTGGGGGASQDTIPPTIPGNLVVSDPGTFHTHITWNAATDNIGVQDYEIFRDGSSIGTSTKTSYDDTTTIPGGTYVYTVRAIDTSGNDSDQSDPVSITLGYATVFNDDDTVPGTDGNDSGSIEVGMKFQVTTPGTVTGVRFYKSAADTGTHIGNLWDNSGNNLARVTFTGESATGWQSALFSSPVHISANTTYVISYFAPNGHYTASSHYFDTLHETNNYVVGLSDSDAGGNDVYNYGSGTTFPTQSHNATNYWMDVEFAPDTGLSYSAQPSCGAYPSFPDETCTGIPAGTHLNAVNQQILQGSNQVYSNLKVNGNIIVTGCDDTLKNIEVDAGEQYTTDQGTPDLFAIWLQVPSNCSTTIDHVSIITGSDPSDNYVTEGVRVANGGPLTLANTKILGTQLGMTVGPGLVQDNYIELGSVMRNDHNEDLLEDGTSNLTINHNTMLNQNSETAALSLFTENQPNSDILVEDNLLAGGGYTCYCGDGLTTNAGAPAPANDVSFINNVFWRKYFSGVGFFAYGRNYNPAGGGQWTNNLYMDQDGTLTEDEVAQPPLAN